MILWGFSLGGGVFGGGGVVGGVIIAMHFLRNAPPPKRGNVPYKVFKS